MSQPNDADELWLAIGQLKSPRKSISLSQDDIIRLGRVRYLVKELQPYSLP